MNKNSKRYHEVIRAMSLFHGIFMNNFAVRRKFSMSDNYQSDIRSRETPLTGDRLANNLAIIKRLSADPLVSQRNDPELPAVLEVLISAQRDFRKLECELIELAYAPRMRRGALAHLASDFEAVVDDYLQSMDPCALTKITSLVEQFRGERYDALRDKFRGPALEEAEQFFRDFDELWFDLTHKSFSDSQ